MRIQPLISSAGTAHHGVEVLDFDLANAPEQAIRDLGRLVADRLIVVVRGANISKERHWLIARTIGHVHGVPKGYPMNIDTDEASENLIEWHYHRNGKPHLPGLFRVSGIRNERGQATGFFADGTLHWHMNQGAVADALPCVALHGAQGTQGSVTEFIETQTLYADLDSAFLERIDGIEIIHQWRSHTMAPSLSDAQDAALKANMFSHGEERPQFSLVWRSPSGALGLRFSPHTFLGFSGLDPAESNSLAADLWSRMSDPALHYRHEWQDGDVLYFDNTITLHRRPGTDTTKRLIHRVAFGYNHALPAQPDYEVKGFFSETPRDSSY